MKILVGVCLLIVKGHCVSFYHKRKFSLGMYMQLLKQWQWCHSLQEADQVGTALSKTYI